MDFELSAGILAAGPGHELTPFAVGAVPPSGPEGDTVIAHGNREFKVTAVLPVELAAEFVDRALYGALEVEPL